MRSMIFVCGYLVLAAYLLTTAGTPARAQTQPPDSESLNTTVADDSRWSEASFWESSDGQPVEDSWEFTDGEVRLIKPRGGKGSLLSPPLPAHFELSFDWRIDEKTNSGLKYRVRQFGKLWLGIEYQLIDEPIPLTEQSKGSTASIYDLKAATTTKPLHPAPAWNSARIVAIGDRVEHYLNGQLVAASPIRGADWESSLAHSKFFARSDFGQPVAGDRVMLTDHGGEVAFKNFHFVACEAPPESSAPQPSPPQLGNAMRNGWATQDSIVIWTRTTRNAEMLTDAPNFRTVAKDAAASWTPDMPESRLLDMQLPAGKELDEVLGACPGAAGEVRLTYFPVLKRKSKTSTPWSSTVAASDFTHQWNLENLLPNTEYATIVEARPLGGSQLTAVVRGGFRTAPQPDHASDLRFCVTTCHDFERRDGGLQGHAIYPSMTDMDPHFVVHAGDIEYYDKAHPWAWTKELMRFKWARIFSLPRNRAFYANRTTYFIKDDHDTLKNDCWSGQTYGAVTFEEGVRLFNEEQFPSRNPRYDTISWGKDIQLWVLEGRDYRSPNNMPDGPEKSILGAEQKEWLFETLRQSQATFKLVFTPTPVVGPDRDNKKDNHANDVFAYEGNEIRQKLSEIDSVIVFCGDRHWQYASVDEQSGLWEFGCGPGSANHQLGWKQGDVRPDHRFLRVAAGFLSGEVTHAEGSQPQLTIRHHNVAGDEVSRFVFPQD